MFLGLRKLFFTSGGYTPQVPSQGAFYDYAMSLTPVAYWRLGEEGSSDVATLEHNYELDETSGTTVDDSEGTSDGTYENTPTLNQTALDGGSGTSVYMEFQDVYGDEPHISITSAASSFTKTDGFQIEFYFKTNNTPTLSYKNVFFCAVAENANSEYTGELVKLNMDADGAFRLKTVGQPWDDVVETNEVFGSGYDDNTTYKLKLILYGDGTRAFYIDDTLVSPNTAGGTLVVDWDEVDHMAVGALIVEEN